MEWNKYLICPYPIHESTWNEQHWTLQMSVYLLTAFPLFHVCLFMVSFLAINSEPTSVQNIHSSRLKWNVFLYQWAMSFARRKAIGRVLKGKNPLNDHTYTIILAWSSVVIKLFFCCLMIESSWHFLLKLLQVSCWSIFTLITQYPQWVARWLSG